MIARTNRIAESRRIHSAYQCLENEEMQARLADLDAQVQSMAGAARGHMYTP